MLSAMEASRAQHRRRGYGQFCAVAAALDVVGERWTLLIVRDLLLGPKRYTDLREGLPGIATDLLTARLRTLESAGLVRRRRLPPPAPASVYELTERGYLLAPAVRGLAQVGFAFLGEPTDETAVSAERLVLALHAAFDSAAVPGLDASYELHLGEEPFAISVRDGALAVRRGPAADPDLTLRTDQVALIRLLGGERDAGEAIAAGDLTIDGPSDALERFVAAFSWERLAASA
jgi:DNA-binding HxlR family transcriptional regulator